MNCPVPAKTALHQAINLLERWQNRRGSMEPLATSIRPHVELALRLALRSAVTRGRLTCFVSETFSPDRAALHMLCAQAGIQLDDMMRRDLEQPEFNRLASAAAKISASSVQFASPSSTSEVAGDLLDLNRAQGLQAVVCERRTDTDLDSWRDELEFVSRMTGAEIHLVSGRLPAAGRFIPGFGQRA